MGTRAIAKDGTRLNWQQRVYMTLLEEREAYLTKKISQLPAIRAGYLLQERKAMQWALDVIREHFSDEQ